MRVLPVPVKYPAHILLVPFHENLASTFLVPLELLCESARIRALQSTSTGSAVRSQYLSYTRFSTEAEDPSGHRAACRCSECLLQTRAEALLFTARRTMQVAGISSRTRWAARSRPGCRSSSSSKLCVCARCACRAVRRIRPLPLGVRAGRAMHSQAARLRVVLFAYSEVAGAVACGRQRLVTLAAPCACAQLAEQQLPARCRPDGARQYDHTDQPVRSILGRRHGRALHTVCMPRHAGH